MFTTTTNCSMTQAAPRRAQSQPSSTDDSLAIYFHGSWPKAITFISENTLALCLGWVRWNVLTATNALKYFSTIGLQFFRCAQPWRHSCIHNREECSKSPQQEGVFLKNVPWLYVCFKAPKGEMFQVCRCTHLFWESTKSQKHCSGSCVQGVCACVSFICVCDFTVNVTHLLVKSWFIWGQLLRYLRDSGAWWQPD